MIHGGGSEVARSGLEKLIISRKLKSSLGRRGGNARLFLFGVALPSPPLPSLPPSLLPLSPSSSRSPGNGRNFKRKFTNEGDFPSPPPTIQRPTLGCNAEGKGGKSRHAVVFRAFSTPASTRSTRGRPPLFSSISLSLSLSRPPFFFIFRGLVALVQWGSRKGEGGREGRPTASKRESVHRERKCAFPLERALFNPRSLVLDAPVSIHPPVSSTLLSCQFSTHRRKPQSGSRPRSAWIFFPPLTREGERRKEKRAIRVDEGEGETEGQTKAGESGVFSARRCPVFRRSIRELFEA